MSECKESGMLPGVVAENPLEFIFIKNKKGLRYSGYIAGLPDVIAQGQSKRETVIKVLSILIGQYNEYLTGNE